MTFWFHRWQRQQNLIFSAHRCYEILNSVCLSLCICIYKIITIVRKQMHHTTICAQKMRKFAFWKVNFKSIKLLFFFSSMCPFTRCKLLIKGEKITCLFILIILYCLYSFMFFLFILYRFIICIHKIFLCLKYFSYKN